MLALAQQIPNPKEKIRYYRHAADQAELSANAAKDDDVRRAYLGIMRTWIYLADELERELALAGAMIDQTDEDFIVPPRGKGAAHRSR